MTENLSWSTDSSSVHDSQSTNMFLSVSRPIMMLFMFAFSVSWYTARCTPQRVAQGGVWLYYHIFNTGNLMFSCRYTAFLRVTNTPVGSLSTHVLDTTQLGRCNGA